MGLIGLFLSTDDLSLALKALLRRVNISFVASRFLGGGKKIWVLPPHENT
jgi:hypothetical protein